MTAVLSAACSCGRTAAASCPTLEVTGPPAPAPPAPPTSGVIAVGSLVPDQDSARTAAIMRAAGVAQPAPDGSIPASISLIRLAGRLRLPGALSPNVPAMSRGAHSFPAGWPLDPRLLSGAVADGPHRLASLIRYGAGLALGAAFPLALAACGPAGTAEAIDHFCPSADVPGCEELTR